MTSATGGGLSWPADAHLMRDAETLLSNERQDQRVLRIEQAFSKRRKWVHVDLWLPWGRYFRQVTIKQDGGKTTIGSTWPPDSHEHSICFLTQEEDGEAKALCFVTDLTEGRTLGDGQSERPIKLPKTTCFFVCAERAWRLAPERAKPHFAEWLDEVVNRMAILAERMDASAETLIDRLSGPYLFNAIARLPGAVLAMPLTSDSDHPVGPSIFLDDLSGSIEILRQSSIGWIAVHKPNDKPAIGWARTPGEILELAMDAYAQDENLSGHERLKLKEVLRPVHEALDGHVDFNVLAGAPVPAPIQCIA